MLQFRRGARGLYGRGRERGPQGCRVRVIIALHRSRRHRFACLLRGPDQPPLLPRSANFLSGS